MVKKKVKVYILNVKFLKIVILVGLKVCKW